MDEKKNEYLTTKNLFFVCLVVNGISCCLIGYLNCVGLSEKKKQLMRRIQRKRRIISIICNQENRYGIKILLIYVIIIDESNNDICTMFEYFKKE